ncbi:MAG: hypothetical protein OSB41_08950 [Kiritimatiellae bacterium]|nr:hypothetical protein [Kiritimatiellia bacterium]
MKSSFELAMEKLGGATSYTPQQMDAFAEIDRRYAAKRAELNLSTEDRVRSAEAIGSTTDDIREQLSRELTKLAEKEAADKAAVRDS